MRESKTLEFKGEFSKTFLKTVSAFANYSGGKIIFGVSDEGEIVGISDPIQTCLDIENSINDALDPVPNFELLVNDGDKTITLVVAQGQATPYLYRGRAYCRRDSATVEVDRMQFNRLILNGMNVSFDALATQVSNLEFSQLEAELQKKIGLAKISNDALVSLELMSASGAFNNAAILLSDKNTFPGLDIARFGVSKNIILGRNTFDGLSVLDQMRRALDLFDGLYSYEEIDAPTRTRKWLIPRDAFREALANAISYRAWDISATIQISMYEDKVEISSPGGLPEGMTQEKYIAGGMSAVRNPILANVLYRLGYIERFGTGVPRIIAEYEILDVSPDFVIDDCSISVILPTSASVVLNADEQCLIDVLPKGSTATSAELSQKTKMSKSKTIRLLNALIEKGLVKKSGSTKAAVYIRN